MGDVMTLGSTYGRSENIPCYTMRRDLLNNVLRLWAGIFLLNI